MRFLFCLLVTWILHSFNVNAQVTWENVDSLYQPLPANVHVYRTNSSIESRKQIAYYVIADLKDKKLEFTVDTSQGRRLSPSQFFEKNKKPVVVVNTTFFSFATNSNLNIVMKNKKLLAYNIHTIPGKGRDTFQYSHPLGSAIGISKKRKADVSWIFTDSTSRKAYHIDQPAGPVKNKSASFPLDSARHYTSIKLPSSRKTLQKWKMVTAVGGGPVLVQNGQVNITNNEEMKFGGKAQFDRHPRTLMGYTSDNKIIIMVIEGRNPGMAEGVTLPEAAQLLKDIGCIEALNLDGGGSSCMLVNGKPTIKVSDRTGERAVPAVFLIK